jgi:hypothetical protein
MANLRRRGLGTNLTVWRDFSILSFRLVHSLANVRWEPASSEQTERGDKSQTYLGTPSLVNSWNRYVMMAPIFGGFRRTLSFKPVPTLKVLLGHITISLWTLYVKILTFPDPILHLMAPVTPLFLPFPSV